MILLDAANNLQAVAAWGSMIIAIITLLLYIRSQLTTKKIAELSVIAEKLGEANEMQQKALILQLKQSERVRILEAANHRPVFSFVNAEEFTGWTVFRFMNESPYQANIRMVEINGEVISMQPSTVSNGNYLDITHNRSEKAYGEPVTIVIIYKGESEETIIRVFHRTKEFDSYFMVI